MREFARDEWQRAQRALQAAEQLIETDPDSSASRSYYAAFHAVTALFALRDRSFSKHAAVRTAVHREMVNTGKWPPDLGKDYDYLMDLRETGDYGGLTHVSESDALSAVDTGKRILEAVRTSCPELA